MSNSPISFPTSDTTPTFAADKPANSASDSVMHDELMSRVVRGAHDTIDRLASTAAPHVERIEKTVSSAQETLHNKAHQAKEMSDEWTQSLRSTVRDNPLAAVASALAVGLLIARITR
jgi:ElaB/YqjD/DUF883 family membrane-anchored ribosome-binding protein